MFQNVEPSGKLEQGKDAKLQDLVEKLIFACASIGGSYIEQNSWIRKNFIVNSELQEEANGELQSGEYFVKTLKNPQTNDWKVVSRQNWDFSTSIETSQLSRLWFWKCQDFLNCRDRPFSSIKIESIDRDHVNTNRDSQAYF